MTNRDIMQQALDALIHHRQQTRPIDLTDATIEALRQELAKPEQEEPLSPVDIGVDVTPEGTHVVAFYNRPDAVQEMFYSQFHPLAKPEQDHGFDRTASHMIGEYVDTAPPRKPWVGLTSNEIEAIVDANTSDDFGYDIWINGSGVAQDVQNKLKEKNGG
jgi:hypothetical protein